MRMPVSVLLKVQWMNGQVGDAAVGGAADGDTRDRYRSYSW